MGGCFSDAKKDKQRTTQPIKRPIKPQYGQQSKVDVTVSAQGDIFSSRLSPVENQKIITAFNEKILPKLTAINIETYKNCEWRPVTCPHFQSKKLSGLSRWISDSSNLLNGQSLLYENIKNEQFLIGGCFENNQIKKNEKYFRIFQNGNYYFGQLNKNLVPNGQGQLHIDSKSQTYQGYFLDGIPHGRGKRTINERVFQGTFKRGSIIKGTQKTEKGVYQGQFKDNQKHGKGILRMNSGHSYEGQFKNNKKQGQGTSFGKNKQIKYKGLWKQDEPIK